VPTTEEAGQFDGYPDRLAFHPVDVREWRSVSDLMEMAVTRFGRLDVVVANAGVSRPGPVDALDTERWCEVIDTNLTGVFHCVRAAAPHLEGSGGGRIITVSSALAERVARGASAYCASKAAVEMFTKVCAIELAPKGITVNCLSPGFLDEGMGRELIANAAIWKQYGTRLAMGRPGTGQEAATAAVFLAGRDSAYVNGHVLEVNGGLDW
jgi:3-oxoacyl-[acyl-carrier protein] reductase